jgi:hypothetical protein
MPRKVVNFHTENGTERVEFMTENLVAVQTGNSPHSVTIIFREGGTALLPVRDRTEANRIYRDIADELP